MLKLIICIISIIVPFSVFFTGCVKNENTKICVENLPNEKNSNVEKKQVVDVYQEFLDKFKKENLKSKGIDIEKLFKRYYDDMMEIENIDYKIERINLSKIDNSYNEDLLINISIKKDSHELSSMVCIFVFQENGQFINVLTELHGYAKCSVVDILGNDRQQIVLINDDSGNGYTLQQVKILSYDLTSQKIKIIFNELLRGNSFLPYKEVEKSEFYSISFENEYKFVSKESKGKDILLTSRIFENEEETLEMGSTRFTFDGEKFVPINYYDYSAIAKRIYDSKK